MTQSQLRQLCDQLMDKFDDISHALNLDLIKNYKTYSGCCPIHGGDNPSALQIYHTEPNRGYWTCYTQHCEDYFFANILGFIRAMLSTTRYSWGGPNDQKATFQETLDWALRLGGGTVLKDDGEKHQEHQDQKGFIQANLTQPQTSQPAMSRTDVRRELNIPSKYYLGRGYSAEILNRFDVGYCRHRKRVIVPIYDEDNVYRGWTGRVVGKANPKWLHSKGLNSSRLLYNINNAANAIQKTGVVCITESVGNVMRLCEAGIWNSVGLFGASMSRYQKLLLDSTGALSFVLLMDSDKAGQKAQNKIIKQCENTHHLHYPVLSENDVGDMRIEQVNTVIKPVVDEAIRVLGLCV